MASSNRKSRDFDAVVQRPLPIFVSTCYKAPFRILNEQEILLQDAERLPEKVVRDMCGNSFHPALISSALGSNEEIRR